MRRAALILPFASLLAVASAQDSPPPARTPAFEVASVRENTSGGTRSTIAWPKGSFSAINMQLQMLIGNAYGIPARLWRFTLVDGPEPLLSARFDIQAKTPDEAPEGQHFQMLRTLLAERFKLRVHREVRPTPIYALTLARDDRTLGTELRPSTIDCTVERERVRESGGRFTPDNAPRDAKGRPLCWGSSQFAVAGAQTLTNAGPISDLASSVQAFVDRPVTDATGLSGSFEWQVVFAFGAKGNPDLPLVFTAVQEQLGLKLDARTGPFEVLVIDAVERPTPD